MEIFKTGELINYCITRRSSHAIQDAIDSVLLNEIEHDFKILLALMEEIEIQYPQIIGVDDLYKLEILGFNDHKFDFENPAIEYTYSYIMHLEDQLFKTKHFENKKSRSQLFLSSNTFHSSFSEEALMYIGQELLDKKFIKKMPLEIFVNAFQATAINNVIIKIEWLKFYNKQNDNIGIAMLLHKLCPEECSKDFKCVVFKLNRLFKNKNPWSKDRSFETSLRKVIEGYNPTNEHRRILQNILES